MAGCEEEEAVATVSGQQSSVVRVQTLQAHCLWSDPSLSLLYIDIYTDSSSIR
jgi:hypothetical protein